MRARIGGVPEHFNLPWFRAVDELAGRGWQVSWSDEPGGTGALARSMAEGSLDVAVVLTEGAVAAVANGLPARLVGTHVGTPLHWGIHVHASSEIARADEIQGRRYAISRPGSGSELMALVDARLRGWPTDEMRFVEVGGLQGAREAMAAGEADVFFWEAVMTRPLVDRGEWRCVGIRPTPWPSFVVMARQDWLDQPGNDPRALLEVVAEHARHLSADPEATARLIAHRFDLQERDAARWLAQTSWVCGPTISATALRAVVEHLVEAGRIQAPVEPAALIDPRWARLEER